MALGFFSHKAGNSSSEITCFMIYSDVQKDLVTIMTGWARAPNNHHYAKSAARAPSRPKCCFVIICNCCNPKPLGLVDRAGFGFVIICNCCNYWGQLPEGFVANRSLSWPQVRRNLAKPHHVWANMILNDQTRH